MIEAVQFAFSGQIDPNSFSEFAQHRAAKLELWLEICVEEKNFVKLDVEGQPDLVDSFEMACSLGPQDCLVREVTRRPLQGGTIKRDGTSK